jgi:chondroitin 4-sulfotransferase 11
MVNLTVLKYLFQLSTESSPIRKASKEYIFIHLIKTAGTSLGKVLDLEDKLHLPASEIIRRVGKENWDKCYKFAFVRNPWDKVVSQYKYGIKMNQMELASKPISFERWLNKTHGENKDYAYFNRSIHFAPQLDWLLDDEGKVAVDFIGKFENLHQDFEIVREELGLKKELPFLNSSKAIENKPYQEYFSGDMAQLVRRKYKKDIDYFGYTF